MEELHINLEQLLHYTCEDLIIIDRKKNTKKHWSEYRWEEKKHLYLREIEGIRTEIECSTNTTFTNHASAECYIVVYLM